MRSVNRKLLVDVAQKRQGPISKLIAPHCHFDAVNQLHIIDIEGCTKALTDAGYRLDFQDGTNDGVFTRAYLNGELKAFGFSGLGKEDSIAHACFGAVREEDAAWEVDKAIQAKGVKVDAALKAKLESRYITEGGAARLSEDMKAFDKAAQK